MSETVAEGYEKIIDEKIEKFVAEMFHSPAGQFWTRLLLRRLAMTDIANSTTDFVARIMDTINIEDQLSGERTFNFTGEEVECKLARMGVPHAPHLVDTYMTVRYGAMDYYCLGKEGSVSLWDYTITTKIDLKRDRGGAHGKVRVEVTA
jgi:hypothetical protein